MSIRFLKKSIQAVSLVSLGYYLNSKYQLININYDLYTQIYKNFSMYIKPSLALELTKILLKIEALYTVDKQQYEQRLSANLNGLYLPNIVGLASGYDSSGQCAQGLFDLGFGHIEIGSVNPQMNLGEKLVDRNKIDAQNSYVAYENDIENEGILKCKAALSSFKNKKHPSQNQFPIGVNIQPSIDTKEITPFLSDKDYETCAREAFEFCDYLTINFQGPESAGVQHMLSPQELTKFLNNINEIRQLDIGIQAVLEVEKKYLQQNLEKKEVNKIYSLEVYGDITSNYVVKVPKIFLKLSALKHANQIKYIANNYKTLKVDGLIIVDDYTDDQQIFQQLRSIAQITKNQLPIISVGKIKNGKDIIDRVKNGAWAIQICSSFILNGPSFVDNLMKDTINQLNKENTKYINELIGINVN